MVVVSNQVSRAHSFCNLSKLTFPPPLLFPFFFLRHNRRSICHIRDATFTRHFTSFFCSLCRYNKCCRIIGFYFKFGSDRSGSCLLFSCSKWTRIRKCTRWNHFSSFDGCRHCRYYSSGVCYLDRNWPKGHIFQARFEFPTDLDSECCICGLCCRCPSHSIEWIRIQPLKILCKCPLESLYSNAQFCLFLASCCTNLSHLSPRFLFSSAASLLIQHVLVEDCYVWTRNIYRCLPHLL